MAGWIDDSRGIKIKEQASQKWEVYYSRIILLLSLLLVFIGWKAFYFLTDDAYITFRYASNWLNGTGITWNPEPFLKVEGYSNFLWLLLMTAVWKFTGIMPPDSVNIMSLLFGFATITLVFSWLKKLQPSTVSSAKWLTLCFIGLLTILSNTTFLTWLSSGLETAKFNFLVLSWLYCAFFGPAEDQKKLFLLSTLATLIALSRPEGYLFIASTLLITVLVYARQTNSFSEFAKNCVISCLPLLVIVAHLLWRFSYYHDWLPNTYYAKVVRPWPEMGLRYAASFILEYGYWFHLAILFIAAGIGWQRFKPGIYRFLAIATVSGHMGYYIFIVGGDHFEYRIFSYLVPLLQIALLAFCAAFISRATFTKSLVLLISCLLLSLPLSWTHHMKSAESNTRNSSTSQVIISNDLVFPFNSIATVWESLQAEMLPRQVGARRQLHKIFWLQQRDIFPTREQGEKVSWEGHPIHARGSVGVASWALPHVAILDTLGLNDPLTAKRESRQSNQYRAMAHDKQASQGYIKCMSPNVEFPNHKRRWALEYPISDEKTLEQMRKIEINKREEVFSDKDIVFCQRNHELLDLIYFFKPFYEQGAESPIPFPQ